MSIDETNVVDFVCVNPDNNEVELCVTDHLEWTGIQKVDCEHLYLLQEKIARGCNAACCPTRRSRGKKPVGTGWPDQLCREC